MPNRRLTAKELAKANALLELIRKEIDALCGGDGDLKFAYRRKVYKELTYEERSKPMVRRALKAKKRKEQDGKCPICKNDLPEKYCVLDRFRAAGGYTIENTRLICQSCDTTTQSSRLYS